MFDTVTFETAVLSLKTASDIAKGLLNLKSLAEVQGKVIDLQEAILSAQSSALAAQSNQFSMVERVRQLEKEIANIKAWEEKSQRYKLMHLWDGSTSLVYALKESCKGTEEAHWICTKCYDDGRRTILQPKKDTSNYILLACGTCMLEIHTGTRSIQPPQYAPG